MTIKQQPAISINGVTKSYRIYPTPTHRLRDALGWKAEYKQFDALHEVSFDIMPGEFWGIVGKNGSGKSTLLKIVAGQLQPTEGEAVCSGKITLLQLGLGFDPELTGLENIRQSRMLQNLSDDFESVVEFVKSFSELGDFINFPVKTYSSGMHSRLGFATAIAGDPDVLIADEVLAVGDMNFSQKCLAKMREFKDRGKTVVLVTHDVNSVKSFCDHGAWLNEGRLIRLGSAKTVAESFRNFMLYGSIRDVDGVDEVIDQSESDTSSSEINGSSSAERWLVPKSARRTVSSNQLEISGYRFLDHVSRKILSKWRPGETIEFQIAFRASEALQLHSFAFTLHDRNGLIAIHLNSEFFDVQMLAIEPCKRYEARFCFDVPMLAEGDYSISFGCSSGKEGKVIEKFDHDSVIQVDWDKSNLTNQQGGYVVVPSGSFTYHRHD